MSRPVAGAPRTQLFVEHEDVWQDQLTTVRRLDGEPGVEHVEDGVVLPLVRGADGRLSGGVVRRDGTPVLSGRHLQHAEDLESPANVLDVYPLHGPPVRRRGTAVYAGGGGKVKAFGHFLVEDLARLWYVVDHPELDDAPVVFINPGQDLDDAGFRLLEIAGVRRDRILVVDEPTVFDHLVVPDQSLFLHPGSMHHAASRRTFDAIRDGVAPGPYEKIYLTYRQMNRKQLSLSVNEEMLEDLYERHGFTVIAPERLSVEDQVSAVSGAREIACTAGTLSHLVAFAQDGVTLDVFVRDKDYLPEVQWSLNEMRSARVNVVDLLRPVFPANARRGVIYYTSTPQWAEFARDRFGADEPSEPPRDYVGRYVTEWAQLLGGSRKWALDLMPEWRASDLVESVYDVLLPTAELSEEQRLSLQRRFYAPERRIEDLESRLESQAAASARALAEVRRQLGSVSDDLRAVTAELQTEKRKRAAEDERARAVKQRLRSVEASRSWRVTRPLRRASTWLGRAPRLQRPLRIARSVLKRR